MIYIMVIDTVLLDCKEIMIMNKKPFYHHMIIDLFLYGGKIQRYYYLGDMRELRDMLDELFHWEDCFYMDLDGNSSGHIFNL